MFRGMMFGRLLHTVSFSLAHSQLCCSPRIKLHSLRIKRGGYLCWDNSAGGALLVYAYACCGSNSAKTSLSTAGGVSSAGGWKAFQVIDSHWKTVLPHNLHVGHFQTGPRSNMPMYRLFLIPSGYHRQDTENLETASISQYSWFKCQQTGRDRELPGNHPS